ncbi:MAG: GNAT family N-acetyltransferase [Gammaproteobacteria bacterium]|nr:GNAT family N-acetyltransferase [Gammaproteobacteria bacterium]MDH5628519.1 GNAT family N-acetyltransferase [Gammaproteobacteria bacterium]
MLKIIPAKTSDSNHIAEIAKPIWREHYTPIIGADQVEYMLKNFQSQLAVEKQMNEGYSYFIIQFDNSTAGYMSVQQRENTLFLSKFYLSNLYRGQGLARKMLDYIEALGCQLGCEIIELTVNKYNPAYHIYLKMGFVSIESIQIDIGEGYIMDDYRMQKVLADN